MARRKQNNQLRLEEFRALLDVILQDKLGFEVASYVGAFMLTHNVAPNSHFFSIYCLIFSRDPSLEGYEKVSQMFQYVRPLNAHTFASLIRCHGALHDSISAVRVLKHFREILHTMSANDLKYRFTVYQAAHDVCLRSEWSHQVQKWIAEDQVTGVDGGRKPPPPEGLPKIYLRDERPAVSTSEALSQGLMQNCNGPQQVGARATSLNTITNTNFTGGRGGPQQQAMNASNKHSQSFNSLASANRSTTMNSFGTSTFGAVDSQDFQQLLYSQNSSAVTPHQHQSSAAASLFEQQYNQQQLLAASTSGANTTAGAASAHQGGASTGNGLHLMQNHFSGQHHQSSDLHHLGAAGPAAQQQQHHQPAMHNQHQSATAAAAHQQQHHHHQHQHGTIQHSFVAVAANSPHQDHQMHSTSGGGGHGHQHHQHHNYNSSCATQYGTSTTPGAAGGASTNAGAAQHYAQMGTMPTADHSNYNASPLSDSYANSYQELVHQHALYISGASAAGAVAAMAAATAPGAGAPHQALHGAQSNHQNHVGFAGGNASTPGGVVDHPSSQPELTQQQSSFYGTTNSGATNANASGAAAATLQHHDHQHGQQLLHELADQHSVLQHYNAAMQAALSTSPAPHDQLGTSAHLTSISQDHYQAAHHLAAVSTGGGENHTTLLREDHHSTMQGQHPVQLLSPVLQQHHHESSTEAGAYHQLPMTHAATDPNLVAHSYSIADPPVNLSMSMSARKSPKKTPTRSPPGITLLETDDPTHLPDHPPPALASTMTWPTGDGFLAAQGTASASTSNEGGAEEEHTSGLRSKSAAVAYYEHSGKELQTPSTGGMQRVVSANDAPLQPGENRIPPMPTHRPPPSPHKFVKKVHQ
ncbi:unnamed protein product [Amoebophrya sp. A120]|nr:unnamed protein product [Amoebophrya sp. A120]|eukprot:GSA120T00004317001.1